MLFRIIRLLLKPIIHFCVSNNIRLQEFEEIAKLSFIDVAKEKLEEQGESSSQSRLSVITGIHRRDINRLYVQKAEPKLSHNLLTRVIGQWRTDPEYLSKGRIPKALSVDGKESQFIDLVQSVSREANPYAVLFELERIGLVSRTEEGLTLRAEGFVPTGDAEQGLLLLARDASDLLAAVQDNVIDGVVPPHLHISTEFDNIPPSALLAIKQWFLDEGGKFHDRARRYLMKFDRDVSTTTKKTESGRIRAVVGTFSRVHSFRGEKKR
jgi:Family of unknown function (DUF6502)